MWIEYNDGHKTGILVTDNVTLILPSGPTSRDGKYAVMVFTNDKDFLNITPSNLTKEQADTIVTQIRNARIAGYCLYSIVDEEGFYDFKMQDMQ